MRKLSIGSLCRATAAIGTVWRQLTHMQRGFEQTARLMIGIPDYQHYLEHCRQHHPERTPMSYEAFFRNRLDSRYGGGGRIGCC